MYIANSNSNVANCNSHFKCSKLQFKCSKLQFTFQISPFTKYGHHGSLMNYTTEMLSKHTCKQCQQHFCMDCIAIPYSQQIQITFTIRQFIIISSSLAMHDYVSGIKVFNKFQITCHIIAIHISVRQITFQRIQANDSTIY